MIRPQRASTARVLARSPEPRRPLLWSIEEVRSVVDFIQCVAHEWQCLLCASGTGQAPTHHQADQAAHIHHQSHHTNEGTSSTARR